jgi:protein involved in polysaccharide export with SLBB domain
MRLSLFSLILFCLFGCPPAAPVLKSAGDVPQEESSAYATVGPSDLLQIRVVGEQALSGEYRVSPKGSISFPWLGDIAVNGLLAGEIQTKLSEGLKAGYLRDPQVIVDIKEANSQKIYVFGQIKSPGTFRYKDHMSVIEAIALAGGLTVEADGNNVTVTRVRDGVEVTYNVRINDIAVGKARNVELLPGDILNVPLRKW